MTASFDVYQLEDNEFIRSTDFYSYKVDGNNAVLSKVFDSVDDLVSDHPARNFWRILGENSEFN